MIVVSDTSPICYLLLIDEIDLLPQLYGQVLIPQTVQQELASERSPVVIQNPRTKALIHYFVCG